MTARRQGPQLASRRSIDREQAPSPVGTVARTVQEAIDTGEAMSVGAVNLVTNTRALRSLGPGTLGQKPGPQLSRQSGVPSPRQGRSVATSAALVGAF